jgi:hypothetical protein
MVFGWRNHGEGKRGWLLSNALVVDYSSMLTGLLSNPFSLRKDSEAMNP